MNTEIQSENRRKLLAGTLIVFFVLAMVIIGIAIPSYLVTWYEYQPATAGLSKSSYSGITYHDLGAQNRGDPHYASPSEGELTYLCIPIQFSDYPFEERDLERLNTLFNGTSEDTGYWESVSSYYNKASYGKMKLTVEVADVYRANYTSVSFAEASSATSRSNLMCRNAVENYLSKASDIGKFDADSNGYFDGIYLIYSCPDFAAAAKQEGSYATQNPDKDYSSFYWACTAWYNSINSGGLKANAYVWASIDFMYKGTSYPNVDAHTFIHETGHLLGLPDYYNDGSREPNKYGTYATYSPSGALQMMDHNIGDFDAWTKYSLGWSEPYVLDSSVSLPVTYELTQNDTSGDVLLIPDKGSSFNGNAFGEYLAVELYSPTGLNALDSANKYCLTYAKMYENVGVRITHVDARLKNFSGRSAKSYASPTREELASSSESNYYDVAANNLLSLTNAELGFWFNNLIESEGHNTLTTENASATNVSLFIGNELRGNFSMSTHGDFFKKKDENGKALFNNGNEFGYKIRVNGIKNENGVYKASITISED